MASLIRSFLTVRDNVNGLTIHVVWSFGTYTEPQTIQMSYMLHINKSKITNISECLKDRTLRKYNIVNSFNVKNEPPRDKTNKVSVRPAKTRISLGMRPVWSEPSLCAKWVAKDPSCLHADSEDSDQTGRMPRLIWAFAGRTATLLVLSQGGSNDYKCYTVSRETT